MLCFRCWGAVALIDPHGAVVGHNERLGLTIFESRKWRPVSRCPPESTTPNELVYNTAIRGS